LHLHKIALSSLHFLGSLLLILFLSPGAALARGGGGCLARGTPILTPSGPVPIEKLHPGDGVWTVCQGQLKIGTVQASMQVEANDILELTVAGRTLRITPEHPIEIGSGTFRLASWLKPGDMIHIWEGNRINSAALTSIGKSQPKSCQAYNL